MFYILQFYYYSIDESKTSFQNLKKSSPKFKGFSHLYPELDPDDVPDHDSECIEKINPDHH